jgi:formylmethanofuran dehydrogenase subunit A
MTTAQADAVQAVVAEQVAKMTGFMKVVKQGGVTYQAYAEAVATLQGVMAQFAATPAAA